MKTLKSVTTALWRYGNRVPDIGPSQQILSEPLLHIYFMLRNNANPQPTPKPLVSVPTAPSPPLQLCADRSACIHGRFSVKRCSSRAARM